MDDRHLYKVYVWLTSSNDTRALYIHINLNYCLLVIGIMRRRDCNYNNCVVT